MTAYYNEIDPYAAQWLRNLIEAGHIAYGVVDERSIEDVRPDEIAGYTQCHFFAGIGVWSYALRLAGWPDDKPVWTGSCPCQPFSQAGKGRGFADERHLWPAWHHLISECRPPVILGEQVASKDVDPWIDLVFDDLEALEYACAANPFPSAGVGAPHIRDRTFFVAHAARERWNGCEDSTGFAGKLIAQTSSADRWVADSDRGECDGLAVLRRAECDGQDARWPQGGSELEPRRDVCGVADAHGARSLPGAHAGIHSGEESAGTRDGEPERSGAVGERPGPTNGFWRAADWLLCRDGKWRPVESQPQPLVDGFAESLGLVRADIIAALTEEINATAMGTKVVGTEAMRNVWKDLGAQAKRCWPARGLPGLHEAPFLLAFVRQLAAQRWIFAQGIPLPRPETSREDLRGMRDDEAIASASHRRELDKQRAGERPDAVRFLSCVLARHAQAAWGEAYKTYAAIGFPLAHGAPARVGRLRAYGNAINAQAAKVFIESVMDCMP